MMPKTTTMEAVKTTTAVSARTTTMAAAKQEITRQQDAG